MKNKDVAFLTDFRGSDGRQVVLMRKCLEDKRASTLSYRKTLKLKCSPQSIKTISKEKLTYSNTEYTLGKIADSVNSFYKST